MAPKCKSSDVGDSDMPKRSQKVLPLSEKVQILNQERTGLSAEVAKLNSNNASPIPDIGKKFVLVLLSQLRPQKL